MTEKIYLVETVLHNVQSHKHTVVKWSPGLNMLVGANDSGKTALQRGLNWNIYNESGSDFIRKKDNEVDKHGSAKLETESYVSNIYSNGVTITRKFEKSTNIYEVIDENGEVFLFDGFRGDIPEMVSKATGISPMVISENLSLNLNIVASRGRSLIDLNGAEKAQIIGAFANVNVIDVSIKEANAEIKRNNDASSKVKTEIERLNQEVELMGDMAAQEEMVNKIDELFFSISEFSFIRNDVIKLKASIEERKSEIESLKKTLLEYKTLSDDEKTLATLQATLYKLKDDILELTTKKERLSMVRERMKTRIKEIEDSKEIIKKCGDLTAKENELLKTEVRLGTIQKEHEKRSQIKEKLFKSKESIANKVSLITRDKSVVEKYKNVLAEEHALEKSKKALEKHKENIKSNSEKKEVLIKLRNSITNGQSLVQEDKKIIERHKNLQTKEMMLEATKRTLEKHKNDSKAIAEKKEILVKLNGSIAEKVSLRKDLRNKIFALNSEIERHTDNCVEMIKEMGKCPLCLSNIDENHLTSIRKELEE